MSRTTFIKPAMLAAFALFSGIGFSTAEPAPVPASLRVLVVRGLWSEQARLEEALALAGAGLVEDAWVYDGAGSGWPGPGDQGNGGLVDFPDAAGLARYDVVVAVNVNAKSFGKSAGDLAAFVRNGGGLFLFGGRFALGRQYRESVLSEIAPAEFPGLRQWGSDLVEAAEGLELKSGAGSLGGSFGSLPWDGKPVLFWYHEVVPKAGADVCLTAGGRPVLVAGESGKGRVAVFAGTVMGVPAKGQAAFWEWPGWPVLEAGVVRWLGEAAQRAAPPAVAESTRKTVESALAKMDAAELMDAASLGDEEMALDPGLEKVLLEEARRCRGAVQADYLVKSVSRIPADMSASLAEALQAAVLPYAGAAGEKAARDLVKSGQPFKTALGLSLLGFNPGAETVSLLGRFYETGKPQAAEAKGEADEGGLMAGPGPERKPVLKADADQMAAAIRAGALIGLSHAGGDAALAIVRKAVNGLRAAGAPRPKEYADILTLDNRLYQQAVMAALLCGDETAAEPLVDALMENIYIVARARNEGNKPKDTLGKVQSLVQGTLVWQREMYRQLALVPDRVRPALAKRLAAEKDRRAAYLALAAFGGKPVPAEAATLLKASPVPAVAALAHD